MLLPASLVASSEKRVVSRADGSLVLVRTYIGNDDTFQILYSGLFYYIVIYALPVVILTAMTYRQILVLARVLSWLITAKGLCDEIFRLWIIDVAAIKSSSLFARSS